MEPNTEHERRDGDVTELLSQMKSGKREAQDELVPKVYPQMRRIAQALMRRERLEHTLQPTALVNEAYMRLVRHSERDWGNRAHFFAGVARIMHQILVDHARHAKAQKCGAGIHPCELNDSLCGTIQDPDLVLEIDRVMHRLEVLDPRMYQVVAMRYFGGLTESEIADFLEIDERTVKREWKAAKGWLRGMLKDYGWDSGPKGPDISTH